MQRILAGTFLRETIARMITKLTDVTSQADEIFISDGAKSDSANIPGDFSLWTIKLRYVIRFTRFMWIQRYGEAEPAPYDPKSETWSDGSTCLVRRNQFLPELP